MSRFVKVEKVCFMSLLLLIIWLPIPLASHRPIAWSVFEIMVALQIMTLIVAYNWSLPLTKLKKYLWLIIPVTLFQLWGVVQFITLPLSWVEYISPNSFDIYHEVSSERASISLDRHATWTSLLKGFAYLLFIINCALLINSEKRVKSVMIAVVVSGTFQAFYAAIVVLMGMTLSPIFEFVEEGIATGSFVYKNHLANYLLMCLAIGFGLIVSQLHQSASGSWQVRRVRWLQGLLSSKMLVRLCLVIMVIALVMTRSRMGNSAFFAITIFAGIVALTLYKNRPRALTVLVMSLLAVDTVVVGSMFGLAEVQERLANTSMMIESRDQVVFWGKEIVQDYPLTGVGLGAFYSVFPSYTQYNIGYYDFAHNEYLQFMIEAGVPATLLLGISVIWALSLSLNTLRVRRNKVFKGAALGCSMAIVGMLIHISVDFQLQPPANAATFLLILVLVGSTSRIRPKIKRIKA